MMIHLTKGMEPLESMNCLKKNRYDRPADT